ncbi:MAG: TauD/TfdA dioxygenase family protein [Candidatus Latescibacterota bacterium]|jgi:alpha-ketoglutarate-dependent taurine dioxygenase
MGDVGQLEQRLKTVFGTQAQCEGPLIESGAVVRVTGIDLYDPLNEDQAGCLLDALSQFRVVCLAGQDLDRFSLAHFERFANHWGAPVPHPSNFLRGGKPAQRDGDSDGPIEMIPYENRRVAAVDKTFPGQLQCMPHESPAVLVVTNFSGPLGDGDVRVGNGGSWHTDIEYEPLPIYVSMFLAHKSPVTRDAPGGTWVEAPNMDDPKPYLEGSDAELMRLRKQLPLNGETAFADTAGAFAALPPQEQALLEKVQLRRRLNAGDEGWLAPLVRTNPRSGLKSFHSPIWASRPRVRPPVEVDGMTMEESRAFLDRLEAYVLQPQFRYDHLHVPGDVTIWDNYMTLHNSTPVKSNIRSVDDARLLYRLSCKGEPALSLPRQDAPEWLEEHINGGYVTPKEIIDV